MGHYLRDFQLSNLNISTDTLSEIDAIFNNIRKDLSDLSENQPIKDLVSWAYIIRFDNKGYRVFSLDDLLSYYRKARVVEKITFSVDCEKSLESNRVFGSYVELRFDSKDPINNILIVTADNKDWVDSTFARILDILNSYKSKNWWIRNGWVNLIIQLFGVTLGFILSIWFALKLAPFLKIENAVIFCFIFVLVMYSNIWTLLNMHLSRFIQFMFPNTRFINERKNDFGHLAQVVFDGFMLAVILYLFGKVGTWLLGMVANLITNN